MYEPQGVLLIRVDTIWGDTLVARVGVNKTNLLPIVYFSGL
jgi:hypothetical protein